MRMWKGAKKVAGWFRFLKSIVPDFPGENFSGIQDPLGIQHFFDLQRQVPGGIIQVDVQVFFFGHADAVFSGNPPAQGFCQGKYLLSDFFCPF